MRALSLCTGVWFLFYAIQFKFSMNNGFYICTLHTNATPLYICGLILISSILQRQRHLFALKKSKGKTRSLHRSRYCSVATPKHFVLQLMFF